MVDNNEMMMMVMVYVGWSWSQQFSKISEIVNFGSCMIFISVKINEVQNGYNNFSYKKVDLIYPILFLFIFEALPTTNDDDL